MSEQYAKEHGGRIEDLPLLDASALAPGVQKRIVFGPGRFWDDYVMRHFTLPAGQKIPVHIHEWDHFALAAKGHGRVVVEGVALDLAEGNWAHVEAGKAHSFENPSDEDFSFFCIVPTHGDPHAKKTAMRAEREERKRASTPE